MLILTTRFHEELQYNDCGLVCHYKCVKFELEITRVFRQGGRNYLKNEQVDKTHIVRP